MEEWRLVEGFSGKYEVSDFGRVRRIAGGRWNRPGGVLSVSVDSRGYPKVRLWEACDGRTINVHRLVARAFIGQRPAGYEINHRDGNKLNCRRENLEYVTRSRNQHHAYAHSLRRAPRGVANGKARLNEKIVREIRKINGKISDARLGQFYGVGEATIREARLGMTWRHVVS